jgi:hypothetical protein
MIKQLVVDPKEVKYLSILYFIGGSVKSFVNRKTSNDLTKNQDIGSPTPDN